MRVELTGGLSISRVALGCMRLHDWRLSNSELLYLIEWCIDNGINTFDHADIYGGEHLNERLFGAAIQLCPSIRHKLNLATKCAIAFANKAGKPARFYDTDREYIFKQVDDSLTALGVDRIDLLFIHMYDLLANPYQLAATLNELVRQGKVAQLGLSNHTTHELELMQAYTIQKFVAHQFKLNPLDITNLSNGVMVQCLSKHIHPMLWSPIGGGEIFSSKNIHAKNIQSVLESVAAEQGHINWDRVIYQWLLMHPGKPTVILGSGNREHIRNALIAEHDNSLSRSQWYRITEAAGYQFW